MSLIVYFLLFYPLVQQSVLACQETTCEDSLVYLTQRGNGVCDLSCMLAICDFDRKTSLKATSTSDCFSLCLQSGCIAERLGNENCDLECDVAVCGWDWGDCGYCAQNCKFHAGFEEQLGNLICDNECDTLECEFDGGDCGLCASGCFRGMISNGVCELPCLNSECGNDGGDCVTQQCSEGCYEYMIGDGFPQAECYVKACDWDRGDFDCAPGCSKEMRSDGVCDDVCNVEACAFDDFECVRSISDQCSGGCLKTMIGNDVCEMECYREECKWDGGDCTCSVDCLKTVLGQCLPSCLNPDCNYDSMPGERNCSASPLTNSAKIFHLLSASFSSEYSPSSMCSSCSQSLWESSQTKCVPECNFPSCLSSFGKCSSSCSEDCEICSSAAVCLQCKPELLQFFTLCVSECPVTFAPHPLIPRLCYYEAGITEFSYYVTISRDKPSQGRSESPFHYIAEAFASVHANSTRILILRGVHSLKLVVSSQFMHAISESAMFVPKAYSVSIEAVNCEENVHVECADSAPTLLYDNLNPVIFRISGELSIRGLILSGKTSMVEGCTAELCYYCLIAQSTSLGVTNERGETLSVGSFASQSLCDKFKSQSLFLIDLATKLEISNVILEHFRQEFQSLISIVSGIVRLSSVVFQNITVGSSVIYQTATSTNFEEGSIEMDEVSVVLLNNGFEYSAEAHFAGFLKSSGIKTIAINGLTSEYCMLGSSVLIDLNNFLLFRMNNSEFLNNLGSTISILSSVQLTREFDFEYQTSLFSQTHVSISNCLWTNNTGRYFVNIVVGGDKLNIVLRGNMFVSNLATISPLLSISIEEQWKSAEKLGGNIPVSIAGIQRLISVLPTRTVIASIHVENCSASHIIFLNNTANINIRHLRVSHSGDLLPEMIQGTLANFIANAESYISSVSTINAQTVCTGVVYLQSAAQTSITLLSLLSNECSAGPSGLFAAKVTEGLSLTDSEFSRNSGRSEDLGSCIDISSLDSVVFTNLTISSNNHYSVLGKGIVALTPLGPIASFSVTGSELIGNTAMGGGLLSASGNLMISDSEFRSNTCEGVAAAGVNFSPSPFGSLLSIQRVAFLNNSALNGVSIVLLDKASTRIRIQLEVTLARFESNISKGSGNSLYIDGSAGLTENSFVKDSVFVNNSAANACVWISFFSGVLSIENCVFRWNTGTSTSVLYGQHPKSTPSSLSFVFLKDTLIEFNTGFSTLYTINPDTYTEGRSQNLTVRSNIGRGFFLMYTYWRDSGSTFYNNSSPTSAPCFAFMFYCQISINNTMFIENRGKLTAGTITMGILSKVNISNCVFEGNFALRGGAIFGEEGVTLNLVNCSFHRNRCNKEGSAMYFLAGPLTSVNSTIVMTNFTENEGQDGTLALVSSYMIIDRCWFRGNKASTAAGILVYLSILTATNTQFSNQSANMGVSLSIAAGSSVNLTSCSFSSSAALGKGGAIFISSSVLSISSSLFTNTSASSGSAIAAYSQSSVSIENSLFEKQLSQQIYGGVIYVNESPMKDRFNRFQDCINGVLIGELANIDSFGSVFQRKSYTDAESQTGAGLYCRDCGNVNIHSGTFTDLSADEGACIHLFSSIGTSSLKLSQSRISNSHSRKTGAVLLDNLDAYITDSVFENNSADGSETEGDGGALYLSCPTRKSGCQTNISDSVFAFNRATHNGGAISWSDWKPSVVNVTFENNSAAYGPDIASFPIALDLLKNVSLNNVPSGQPIQIEILVQLIDHYGQSVTTDNTSLADLLPSNSGNTSISGVTRTQAIFGRFRFQGFTITAKPEAFTSIKVETSSIDITKIRHDSTDLFQSVVNLSVYMRACEVGESVVGDTCFLCPEGKYSLNPNMSCAVCPDGGVCYGNSTMAPKEGYWRSNNITDNFLICPNAEACLGSPENQPFSPTGICRQGYYGNMCHGCLSGYSRTEDNICALCPNNTINVIQIAGIGTAFTLVILFIIKMSLISAQKQQSQSSIFLKIFVNYLQFTAAASSFNLNWPQYALKAFKANESAANVSTQLFSFDCFIDSGSDGNQADTLYLKTIVIAVLPLLIIAVSLLFWGIMAAAFRNPRYLKYQLVNSIVVLFFVAHPSIVSYNFDIFNCREINPGEFWLNSYLNIRCWDHLHSQYALSVALPSLILWGITTPMLALLSLIALRSRLTTLEMKIRFGFLYTGYSFHKYYWEFVIMYRKLIVIAMSVFLTTVSASLQALGVLLVLVIAYVMHVRNMPYNSHVFNQLEERSILVSTVTLYSGLFYITNGLDYYSQIILFSCIVSANLFFVGTWCLRVCEAGCKMLFKRFRFLNKYAISSLFLRNEQVSPIDLDVNMSIDRSILRPCLDVPFNSILEACVADQSVRPAASVSPDLLKASEING